MRSRPLRTSDIVDCPLLPGQQYPTSCLAPTPGHGCAPVMTAPTSDATPQCQWPRSSGVVVFADKEPLLKDGLQGPRKPKRKAAPGGEDEPLGRRLLGTFLTIFFPTILLNVIGYSTNYFKEFFFEGLMGLNVTVMLVLTTMFLR